MSTVSVDDDAIERIGAVLRCRSRPLKERFRALFTLKNLNGEGAVRAISSAFDDPSALLKHELAYCLGQMQNRSAVAALRDVLADRSQEPMVRHEAAEALGAIGAPEVEAILREYAEDPVVDVRETCQIALGRMRWLRDSAADDEKLSQNPFASVDPAPPSAKVDLDQLRRVLLDESASLFDRYRAMFSLRNIFTDESVKILGEGLKASSALFRHEIAFVLGQMQHESGIPFLRANLEDVSENEMVRHECAEALGAIATRECVKILERYLQDEKRVVKESCEIALDMCEYENSPEFQYANSVQSVNCS